MGILYRNSLSLESITCRKFTTFEFAIYRIKSSKCNYLICVIYRPYVHVNFYEEFEDLICNYLSRGDNVYIVGDLNVHFDCPYKRDTETVMSILDAFDFSQCVDFPTHLSGHTLDCVIYGRSSKEPTNVNFNDPGISDHYCVMFSLPSVRHPTSSNEHTARSFKGVDVSVLEAEFNAVFANFPMDCSADDLAISFTNSRSTIADKYAPLTTIKPQTGPPAPWFNDFLRQSKQTKRKLERVWLQTHSRESSAAFRRYCNIYFEQVRSAKKQYYSLQLEKASHDTKKIFKISSTIMGIKEDMPLPDHHDQETSLADRFSMHFSDKIMLIVNECSSLSTVSDPFSLDYPVQSCFLSFHPVTETEVGKILSRSSSAYCPLLDPIPPSFLKIFGHILLPIITKMVNSSLLCGVFPDVFKRSLIFPKLKKPGLDPNELNNYRPISNLSFLSKIVERAACDQIQEYLDTHALLPVSQSAYRSFHSTETALLKVTTDILLSLDNGNFSALVLLDQSAAFDVVNHNILVSRLKSRFGFGDTVLQWITSYLTTRKSKVVTKSILSAEASCSFGVPQGSLLGPLLFSLYTAPIFDICPADILHHSYADDIQLYVHFNSKQQNLQHLETCITNINEWMKANGLKLNPSKTELIIIGPKGSINDLQNITLSLNGSCITSSVKAKNLGVMLNNTMTMETFVNEKCKTISFYLRKISRARNYLSRQATNTLVHAYIFSRLDYCNSLLAGTPQYLINRLQKLLNRAARIVTFTPLSHHISPILISLHWLPVSYRITFKNLQLIYKFINGEAPAYLESIYTLYIPPRELRSANQLLLNSITPKNNYGLRYVNSIAKWNNLPLDIKTAPNLLLFKKALKTHVFKQAFRV